MLQRLQKILAHAGIASRRAAEEIILDGRVRVNGEVVTEMGSRADPKRDRIEVDGQRIALESPVYILMHKPKTVVSTMNDPEGRPTVAEYMTKVPVRVYPIGRLDFQTSGALLLTNDGDFAARMLHPKHHVPKTYLVKLRGEMRAEDVIPWREGIRLDDGMTRPAEAFVVKQEHGYTWLELILREGRNQQIRRMGEATGFLVSRLTRISFAGISIDGLRAGQWRLLNGQELKDLRTAYGVPRRLGAAAESHNRIASLQTGDTARLRAASKSSPRRPKQLARRDADKVDERSRGSWGHTSGQGDDSAERDGERRGNRPRRADDQQRGYERRRADNEQRREKAEIHRRRGYGSGRSDDRQQGRGYGSGRSDDRQQGRGYGSRRSDDRQQGRGYDSRRSDDRQQGRGSGPRRSDDRQQGRGYDSRRSDDRQQGLGYDSRRSDDRQQGLGYDSKRSDDRKRHGSRSQHSGDHQRRGDGSRGGYNKRSSHR